MKFRQIAVSLALAWPTLAPAQGIPVVDAQSIAQQVRNHLESIAKYIEQISVLRDQLASTRQQLDALTGSRGLGAIANNPVIRQVLPPDTLQLWRDLDHSASRLTRAIDSVQREENQRLVGNWSDNWQAALARQQRLTAANKVLITQAYQGQQARLAQLDQLQQEINRTADPKAIAELQARLQVEQANILVDQTRTQLLLQQIAAEQALATQNNNRLVYQLFDPARIRQSR